MGSVYKVFDPSLKRFAAVKILHRSEPGLGERLLREARAQASVDHPHVCQGYEVGEVRRRPYIAMQYIDGERLDAAWSLRTAWRARERAEVAQRFGQEVQQVKSSLRYALLLPLHDTSAHKEALRARTERIELIAADWAVERGLPATAALGRDLEVARRLAGEG